MKVWDPLRKKEVELTPEEKVRQWFIGVLEKVVNVPKHQMMSEVSLQYGQKQYRADVVVYGKNGVPIMVVETKRPEVTLDQSTVDQALRYNAVLGVKYVVVTNGEKTFIFKKEGERFVFLQKAPVYSDMINEQ